MPLESFERYVAGHADRLNLLVHLLAVPAFVLGAIGATAAMATGRWALVVPAIGLVGVSLGLQGICHRREAIPPAPFTGPSDFLTRILREQFLTWWRFLLNGSWLRQWRLSRR